MTYAQIEQKILAGDFAPVYLLYGEEMYFIDKLTRLLETKVLNETEAVFNKELFYGADVQASKILNACQSFPVMATRRLTIVKEAQKLPKAEWNKLEAYFTKPVSSTVLVMASKDKKAPLGKAGMQAVDKNGVSFHAKRMYERDVLQWLEGYLKDSGFRADPGIAAILTTNLGLNLNHIENELEKIFISLKAAKQTHLSKQFVYEMINVDKEFNVFELINALGTRKQARAHMIIDRMSQNVKLNPPVLTVNALFRFFDHVMLVYAYKLQDANSVKNQLKVNYYAAQDYLKAKNNYPLAKVRRNLLLIQRADLMIKGQIPTQMDSAHILKTLVFRLLH